MKQTEIEVEEKEVERVYCDECSDECTDDYRVEASEVCPSCAEGETFATVKEMFTSQGHFDNQEDDHIGATLLTIAMYPLLIPILTYELGTPNPDVTRSDYINVLMMTFGTLLWTCLVIVFVMASL